MEIIAYQDLSPYNTFHIKAQARYFVNLQTTIQIQEILKEYAKIPQLILGGGSNILFTKDFEGIVLHIDLKGINIIAESPECLQVEVAAGENWHNFVLWAVQQGWHGIENLALIPGTVGASAIQNIGAYGVEVKESIQQVNYIDIATQTQQSLSKEQCLFGYRDSIFKNALKNKVVITSIVFQLHRFAPLRTTYGDIQKVLQTQGIETPTLQDVAQAVCQIRQSKLPNPAELGNAGSFFKNPTITQEQLHNLQQKYTNLPSYPTQEANRVKVPAGWLIEQSGWKGKRIGEAGVHTKQALVLVNYGKATGRDMLALAQQIQAEVEKMFGISLETEVNIC